MQVQETPTLTAEQIEERIKKVDGAMALENMPLTQAEKDLLMQCLTGKTTSEIERQKIIHHYRSMYAGR